MRRSVGVGAALAAGLLLSGGSIAADRTESLLAELSNAPGPPGFEEPVRAIMVREMKPLARISYDGMGSVIAQNGDHGPRVMLDAHMDELGAMTRRITPEGFVTMQMLGGWLDQALPGQRWVILTAKGPVKAVSGIRDVHLTPADERTKPFNRDSLFLDIGARSEAEAKAMGVERSATRWRRTWLSRSWAAVGIPARRGTIGSAARWWSRCCGDWRRKAIPTSCSSPPPLKRRSACEERIPPPRRSGPTSASPSKAARRATSRSTGPTRPTAG